MDFNPGDLVRLALTLVGRRFARVILFFFIFGAAGLMLMALAGQATSLIDTWTSDARSVGLVLSVLAPVAMVLGFFSLSAFALAAFVYIVLSGFHGRQVARLRSEVDRLAERVDRLERALGLDDSDSPVG